MHLFECEATFEAEPDAVWKVWTDVARWPEWDVSKEITRLDGPFEPGTCGWAKQRGNLGGSFTITAVAAGRSWVSECPLPVGKVIFAHYSSPWATDVSGWSSEPMRKAGSGPCCGCSPPGCAGITPSPWLPCSGGCPRSGKGDAVSELRPEAEPAELGLDPDRLHRIDRHFARYVDDGRLPGWLITLSRHGRLCVRVGLRVP